MVCKLPLFYEIEMDLKELVIIDASTVLAGPSVGMFFAELGAKVIKVEHPLHGDVTRKWKLPTEDKNSSVSAYFSAVNYKKEYQKLDYTIEADYNQFLKLVEQADILITNFKKGDAEKFNLTDDVLFAKNPQLIHGKISGFGKHSDRVAYDLIVQAESGFMSMNGTPESGPVKMPVALIDVLTAHQLKEGLLVALINRISTCKGGVVEASLYESAVASLINQATNYLHENFIPQRIGSLHPNIAPYGEIFKTKDQHYITFAIGSNTHFEKLCSFLNLSELTHDARFSDNQSRVINRFLLKDILQAKIELVAADEILEAMHRLFVPVGKIKALDEVLNDKNTQHLVLEEQIDGVLTKRLKSVVFHLN